MNVQITAKGFKIDGKQHFFGKLQSVLSSMTKGHARQLRKALWNGGHRGMAATKRLPSINDMPKQERILSIA